MAKNKRDLTPKQACFVEEYMIDLNATAAAVRAGYSERTADRIGPELLGKTWVAEAIQAALAKRSKKTEVTAEYVIKNLREIVERCMQKQGADDYDPRAAAKALELLGKHLGMFADKLNISGELTIEGVLGELAKRRTRDE